jgi:hypothetical protein
MDDKPRHDDPPASVSNQNREEAEPGHGHGEERRQTSDAGRKGGGDEGSGGESGEGSQSTGNPRSAG